MAAQRRRVVISIVGPQGAGKTTIGQKLARHLDTSHIEISGVVRALTDKSEKKELTETRSLTEENPDWLGEAIYERLIECFNEGHRSAVLSGVRETEVYDYLRRRNLDVVGVDVIADPDIRCFRLIELGKISDERSFIEQEIREKRMGLGEVMDRSDFQVTTSPTTDADEIVQSTISAIVNKRKKRIR